MYNIVYYIPGFLAIKLAPHHHSKTENYIYTVLHLETLVPLPGSRLVLERRQAGSERRHSEAREVTSPCGTVQYSAVQYSTAWYSTCTSSHTLSRGWRGQESRCTSPTVTPAHPLYLLLPALLPLLTGDAVAEPQDPAPRRASRTQL